MTPDDRRIARLALPALGALAAGPLYVLVDTAIVGHLGVAPLAALALAGAVIDGIAALCNFLEYGATPRVGRLHAVGDDSGARAVGHQGMLLALMLGVAIGALLAALAHPLLSVLGAKGQVMTDGSLYLRIAAIGVPLSLMAVAAEGYFRGVAKLKTPMWVLLICNGVNVGLEVLFVYGFGWGIAGSAWGTVAAQALMAASFAWMAGMRPGVRIRPDWRLIASMLRVGAELLIRTVALYTAFLLSGAILARVGQASLAAHQIAFQLWNFLALALDSLAIAAQVLVSHELAVRQPGRARELAWRTIFWSFVVGAIFGLVMLALASVLPRAFTSDPQVLNRLGAIWVIFAVMQPVNGIVFALDGILIGAGDTRYLALAMVPCTLFGFLPVVGLTVLLDWGIVGVWCAIFAFILARLLAGAWRFAGENWVLASETAAAAP